MCGVKFCTYIYWCATPAIGIVGKIGGHDSSKLAINITGEWEEQGAGGCRDEAHHAHDWKIKMLPLAP
jgi:hypothetical protein